MRVCIVAEHASYQFGGEAVLPLHYFSRLRARGVEAWLVVHARTRSELETAFAADRERIRFVEDAWFHKLLFRFSRFLPRRVSESTLGLLSQLLTQSIARSMVLDLISTESVDLVHQPIPVSPRFPSLMANLGVPVVIGPMNGGMDYPPAFRSSESFFSRAGVEIGRRFSGLVNSLLPGKKRAHFLLAANKRTRQAFPGGFQGEVLEFPENGVDISTWTLTSNSLKMKSLLVQPARFVFIGRLVDWKAVDIALEALQLVPEAQLEIIGDGPMRTAWQRLAEQLNVSSRVFFSGWLSQRECASRLEKAIALVLPSVYESGGAVVLEAMATGTAVIATNWGGPSDYVDSSCGILIEPVTRQALITGFAGAMKTLIANPELACQLGMRGREVVIQDFDWEKKIDRMISLYKRAVADASMNYRPLPEDIPA